MIGSFAAGGLRPSLVADFAGASGREGYAKPLPILGPELVVNGRFDADLSGWIDASIGTGTVSWTSGAAQLTKSDGSNTGIIRTTFSTISGKMYRLRGFVSGADVKVALGTTSLNDDIESDILSDGEEIDLIFFAQGATTHLYALINAGSGTATIDNISVREITGYRAVRTTFTDLLTHSRSGNATMVDRDGLLKWAPHNFLMWSEDFTNAAWLKQSGASITPNAAIAPDGTLSADEIVWTADNASVYQSYGQWIANVSFSSAIWVKGVAGETVYVRLDGPAMANGQVIALTGDWQLIPLTSTPTVSGSGNLAIRKSSTTANRVFVWGAHLYRSDLGGMVDNPDTGDSYVPTTSAARFLPRRNHHVWDGSAYVNFGVRHEGQARTNLLTYSSDFANAAWSKTNATVTASAGTAPDGTSSTFELTSSVAGYSRVHQAQTASGSSETFSVYASPATSDWLILRIYNVTTATGYAAWFNVSTGTIGTVEAGVTAVLEDAGGMYRCAVSASNTSGNDLQCQVAVATADGSFSTTTESIYIWGAQFEVGATPSSYIPTNGSTVIRPADVLTPPAANLPFHPDGVWLAVEGLVTYSDEDIGRSTGMTSAGQVTVWRWLSSSSNGMVSGVDTSGTRTGQPYFGQRAASKGSPLGETTGDTGHYSPGLNVPFSLSSRHGPTFINGAADGVLATESNAATDWTHLHETDLQLGFDFMGIFKIFVVGAGNPADAGIAGVSA
ncbi:phage head spike fiber domain-containing protein [Marinovum algicola]|uniref:phage head spike fiber domain-containing protein n=1 Tax=Marinovum algicola TaxID=42444 RepID=UPI003B520777